MALSLADKIWHDTWSAAPRANQTCSRSTSTCQTPSPRVRGSAVL